MEGIYPSVLADQRCTGIVSEGDLEWENKRFWKQYMLMGYNALGRALEGSKPRRTQIIKTEGDEPKSAMEMRKAGLQQRSDWPESLSQKPKRRSNCLDGVWGIVSSFSATIIIFCLDYNPLFAMQTLEIA